MAEKKQNELIIIGAGGHGKVCADIAKLMGYREIVFLDDNSGLTHCGRYPVVGPSLKVYNLDGDIFVAIGSNETRRRITEELPEERITSLIHPSAVIADTAIIGQGTVVMAGAVINTDLKEGCIINTCSSADHDCIIGDFVHIAVGCHIAGTVSVGDCCFLGAGSTLINYINIYANSKIGAGAVAVSDIKQPGVYVGVPAKLIGWGYNYLKSRELVDNHLSIICLSSYCRELGQVA